MFNKIQPQQLQLPTFFDNFANILITKQSDTGVNFNLNNNLTGDFNFQGNLYNNSSRIITSDASNSFYYVSGSRVLGGTYNFASGSNNTVVGGADVSINYGYGNLSLNGVANNWGINTRDNTVVAGGYIDIPDDSYGSIFIGDNYGNCYSHGNDCLNIGFISGTYIEGGLWVDGSKTATLADISGLAVTQDDPTIAGQPLATQSWVIDYFSTLNNFGANGTITDSSGVGYAYSNSETLISATYSEVDILPSLRNNTQVTRGLIYSENEFTLPSNFISGLYFVSGSSTVKYKGGNSLITGASVRMDIFKNEGSTYITNTGTITGSSQVNIMLTGLMILDPDDFVKLYLNANPNYDYEPSETPFINIGTVGPTIFSVKKV
jgi:hypothetical protein